MEYKGHSEKGENVYFCNECDFTEFEKSEGSRAYGDNLNDWFRDG